MCDLEPGPLGSALIRGPGPAVVSRKQEMRSAGAAFVIGRQPSCIAVQPPSSLPGPGALGARSPPVPGRRWHSLCWSLFSRLEALGVCSSSEGTVSSRHAVNCCSTFRSAPPSLSAAQMQPIFTGWSTRNLFPFAKNSSHSLAFSF